jgi:hypothetical protein
MSFEILLAKLCHLVAIPHLQQILINLPESKNIVEEKLQGNKDEKARDDLVNEILRNFEGSKITESF